MYIYKIYQERNGVKLNLEYVVSEDNESAKESDARAQKVLEDRRAKSSKPHEVQMSRSLMPGI